MANKAPCQEKRIYVIIILILAFANISASVGSDYEYVESKKSTKYHLPSYRWAQRIEPGNVVIFNSVKEAKKAGYVPCKVLLKAKN